jgi:hypothetical protein
MNDMIKAWHVLRDGLTRRQISQRSGSDGGHMGLIRVDELGQAKVCDVGLHLLIQKDVAAFDVPVDDMRNAVVVQVTQSPGHAQSDLEAQVPVKRLHVAGGVVCKTAQWVT